LAVFVHAHFSFAAVFVSISHSVFSLPRRVCSAPGPASIAVEICLPPDLKGLAFLLSVHVVGLAAADLLFPCLLRFPVATTGEELGLSDFARV
jgi:hypothetical protein